MSATKLENDSVFAEETFALKPLSSLKTWERNYRKGDVDAIIASISRFGFNGALRVWLNDTVMAGNHALLALRQLKDSDAPPPVHIAEADGEWYIKTIDLSHLNRMEATAFAIADNHTQEVGSSDDAALAAMLKELGEHDAELLRVTAYDDAALTALLSGLESGEPKDAPKPQIDRAQELQEKWQVERGQVWQIGRKIKCRKCSKWHYL